MNFLMKSLSQETGSYFWVMYGCAKFKMFGRFSECSCPYGTHQHMKNNFGILCDGLNELILCFFNAAVDTLRGCAFAHLRIVVEYVGGNLMQNQDVGKLCNLKVLAFVVLNVVNKFGMILL